MVVAMWASSTPKTSMLLWRLLQKRLPTTDKLSSRGIQALIPCAVCDGSNETMNHIFLAYPLALWIIIGFLQAVGGLIQLPLVVTFETPSTLLKDLTLSQKSRPPLDIHHCAPLDNISHPISHTLTPHNHCVFISSSTT